ncbi:MAG: ISL3 family transposase [Gemmatimonadaceae bacterium]|nr:ISL3 family transposase [Gemmatimonadaceae bacterium]
MQGTGLFEQALGLERPWYVERTEFDAGQRRLDLYLNFEVGGTFACGGCGGAGCKAYDTAQKQWRHLNFFEHQAYLHAPSPRVECRECGIRQARLPWARPRSGFTLLFEALAMAMMTEMPVKAVARIVGEHDTRLWRIAKHYVNEARAAADHSGVRAVGVDEKASRRGHSYVTFFADLDERRLLYATEGRKWGVLGEFRNDLEAHGGSADSVEELCMDMSPAYIKGARESFPDAEITFDRFHVVQLLNQAVEKVRRTEQKERPELKRSRWLWLWNPERLSPTQRQRLDELLDPSRIALDTARAYQLKLSFQEFWNLPPALALRHLQRWCTLAERSGLAPMATVAATIRAHAAGILRWLHSRISNGMLEAMNSLVQAAKVRARGYRTTENFITMAYLVCGKLSFNLPT